MAIQQKITPCLWFDDDAEDAVAFYLSIFKDSRIVSRSRYGESVPDKTTWIGNPIGPWVTDL